MIDLSFISNKKLPVLLHILAWGILFILPFYLFTTGWAHDSFFFVRFYSRAIVYLIIFYVNYFWLVPRYLFKGKRLIYFFLISGIVTLLFFSSEAANRLVFPESNDRIDSIINKVVRENHIPRPPKSFIFYEYIITSFLISGFSAGLRLSGKMLQHEKERKELDKERLNSELAFLKNQISPHFFFNTLNNIYSLVDINTEDARKAILQLSKMMRYLLYESDNDNSLLTREISFMNSYVDLMRLRLTDKVRLTVSFPEVAPDMSVFPLLFIPFIENAFKHGVSYQGPSFISITMEVEKNEILFTCINSLNANKTETNEASGIGLENVKKRLALLYPGSYQLEIKQTEVSYHVFLKINLVKRSIDDNNNSNRR